MLRLNRKKGESIILETPDGHKAQIIVTDFSATQVQMGIEAPKGIGVWREEIYDVVSQNRQGSGEAVFCHESESFSGKVHGGDCGPD